MLEKGKKFRPRTLSEIMVENQIEKTKKLIQQAERAQFKILQRKKEWEELWVTWDLYSYTLRPIFLHSATYILTLLICDPQI